MKISKLFHWLYASIMFLPLLVAPIFAIYSHRHTINSYEVTREKYQVVDIYHQQMVKNGEPSSFNNWVIDNGSAIYQNGSLLVDSECNFYSELYLKEFNANDKILSKITVKSQNTEPYDINYYVTGSSDLFFEHISENSQEFKDYYSIAYLDQDNMEDILGLYFEVTCDVCFIKNIEIFNLTTMFGSGNEPTIEQFNAMFPNDYYEYTTSKKVLVHNGTETLNNTDIGSQFVYAIYNPLHDYFNFNNYLGIGNLYNWMQLNLFKGTAPLGFYIFWELLMYWLLVSLIWLIFDIAMYVPNLAHRWLDKASLE